jgi:hypothetical protein
MWILGLASGKSPEIAAQPACYVAVLRWGSRITLSPDARAFSPILRLNPQTRDGCALNAVQLICHSDPSSIDSQSAPMMAPRMWCWAAGHQAAGMYAVDNAAKQ